MSTIKHIAFALLCTILLFGLSSCKKDNPDPEPESQFYASMAFTYHFGDGDLAFYDIAAKYGEVGGKEESITITDSTKILSVAATKFPSTLYVEITKTAKTVTQEQVTADKYRFYSSFLSSTFKWGKVGGASGLKSEGSTAGTPIGKDKVLQYLDSKKTMTASYKYTFTVDKDKDELVAVKVE